MSIFADLKMYWRFAAGLRKFLRHRISLDEAREIVQMRMAERENNFLRLVERGIFGYPRSPYLPLLKLAQVEFGDIRDMVQSRGLEKTLRALRESGVYISFEEFKGREPVVREGQVIPVQMRDFDNPFLSHYFEAQSGGTTGAGTRVAIDLEHLAAHASLLMLGFDAHGVLDAPMALWLGILPDPTAVNTFLRIVPFRQVPWKWFTPITNDDLRVPLKYRLATNYLVLAGRLYGVPIPWPEPVNLDQGAIVANWAAETLKAHGACLIRAHASMALRVCIAAQERGLDLTGATFMGAGEPPTPAKVREIVRTGARHVPNYSIVEIGPIGLGCARSSDINDIHLFKDTVALIQYPRPVPGFDINVDAFCFTTLLPTSPKIMLNVEFDDYGLIETRSCGCALESYGYSEHIREIRSFRKLTGEGVTLVGSEMVAILEEVLPSRFGGSPLDYQLAEEEDDQGRTRVSVLVSPRIHIASEAAVIDTILQAMGRSSVAGDIARAIWSQAGILRVKRQEPIRTAQGKSMPLHLARRSESKSTSPTERTALRPKA